MGEKVYKLTARSASASAAARSVSAICQAILILVFQAIIRTCMAFSVTSLCNSLTILSSDVVFVHDATGSLQPYIDDARQFVNNRIRDIQNKAIMNGGDARYRVIAFRDHREEGDLWTVHDLNPFTKDFAVLKRQLDALVTSGGGDGPEAQIDALDAALRSSWRRDAKRIVILITDSPPHGIREPGDVVPASHPGGEQTTSSHSSLMLTLRQP
jgi:hypothetical protein